jgi:RNA polymerase sigma-B factor
MTLLAHARRAPHREDGETLVRRYHETRDDRVRERAIGEYMPLARKLARRYHRGREPLEDLEQVAYVGLLKAVERFDPAYGSRFTSFALPTINGELRRHFRDATWALHAPRWVQEAVLEVTRATDRLANELGRAPTTGEIAAATGLDVEQVTEALVARSHQTTSSLDTPLGDEEGQTVAETVGRDDDGYDLVDHRVTVAPLFAALPAREREVLRLRFDHDMTQTQIARRVGCSQMQVSRLLRRAIARLSQVSDEPQPLPETGASAPAAGAGR